MDWRQISDLNIDNLGDWPLPIKGVLIIVLCALVLGGWYYLDTAEQLDRLSKSEQKEQELRRTFEEKQKKSANLEAYKLQLAEMKESFGAMLRQLPDKTEVAALLVDVSQTGLAVGLEFELFQPIGEVRKEFYAELPIKLKVNGDFHKFGSFVSGLASLPRIVTVHDVTIRPRGKTPKDGLIMEATAKTYRYLDEGAQ